MIARDARAVALRAIAMLAVMEAVGGLLNAVGPDRGGANIGAGLGAFAATLVLAAAWSGIDTARGTRVPRTPARWVEAGALAGAAMTLLGAATSADVRWDIAWADVRSGLAFYPVLALVGAALGAGAGAAVAARRR